MEIELFKVVSKLQNLQECNGSDLLMHWDKYGTGLAIYSIPVSLLFSLVSLTSVQVRLQNAPVVLLG